MGRVLATALNTLVLQSGYRYGRAGPAGRFGDESGSPPAIARQSDGQLAAGADVALPAVPVPGLGQRIWRDKADGRGRYVFDDLPFGVYRVARIESEGKRLETFAPHVPVTNREPVEVGLVVTGIASFVGTLAADVPVPDNTLARLTPSYALASP